MKLHLCLPLLVLAAIVQAQSPAARPHYPGSKPFAGASATLPPFETPASLACVYRLVPDIVPGCPVLSATELPTGGSGMIAIVNAFDYPTAANDLNVFSKYFGLPECNSGNPCFAKVYASGTVPPVDPLWAANASGVIEYAHALAPGARVLLVEAASGSLADLMTAVRIANRILVSQAGGGQVALPFGISEFPGEVAADAYFTAPGVIYISGNQGEDGLVEYPAASPSVIGVGATALHRNQQGNLVREVASTFWSGGKSLFETRPAYQDVIEAIVQNQRGVPDVAFAADPVISPCLYYNSTPDNGYVGWSYTGSVGFGEVGWAAIINRAGSLASSTAAELSFMYANLGNRNAFRDVLIGSAFGMSATPGWDLLTGLGVDTGLTGK